MDTNVKILAVDDVPINLDMLEVMLAGQDRTIIRAENGQQALDILEQHPDTDLVLLDLEMPVMDGFETLERLRISDQWRHIPAIVITAAGGDLNRTLALGAADFLVKPYDPQELILRAMNRVRLKKLADLSRETNEALESELAQKAAALQKALTFSREAEYEITLRLGRAAEFRDQETGMHTRRVSEFSKMLALLAGLSEAESEVLRYAAPLHDVGKIGIPDSILLKPGTLSENEYELMKSHTLIGGKILEDAGRYPVLSAGSIVALQHHERWDGNGYPRGLQGESIHIYGRIVMIVDVFDALSSQRPYKPAFPLEKCRAIMEEGRGTFFDPRLLDLFLKHFPAFIRMRETLCDLPVQQHPPSTLWPTEAVLSLDQPFTAPIDP